MLRLIVKTKFDAMLFDHSMSELLQHNCGLTYVHANDGESHTTPLALLIAANQANRGHDAAGIGLYTPYGFEVHKEIGNIKAKTLEAYANIVKAYSTMVHNRYKTSGGDAATLAAVQPFAYGSRNNRMGVIHNGQIMMDPLVEFLQKKGEDAQEMQSDSDAMGRCLHFLCRKYKGDIKRIMNAIWPMLDGGHNGVMQLADGRGVAWRDQLGLHPLFLAQFGEFSIIGSEDNAIVKGTHGRLNSLVEVDPGEMVLFPTYGKPKRKPIKRRTRKKANKRTTPAHCMFEWFYFMKRFSSMTQESADAVRTRAGEALAAMDKEWLVQRRESGAKDPVVVSIPHTAIPMGRGYSDKIKLPVATPLMRKEGAVRTFITDASAREDAIENKYDIDTELICGRDIILFDDSIVRGPTIKKIIAKLRENGFVGEIHVRIGFPMIYSPCFYGIDMSTLEELFVTDYRNMFAEGKSVTEVEAKMAEDIGADSIKFLPTAQVGDVIQVPDDYLCKGCTEGKYPTPAAQEIYNLKEETWQSSQETMSA